MKYDLLQHSSRWRVLQCFVAINFVFVRHDSVEPELIRFCSRCSVHSSQNGAEYPRNLVISATIYIFATSN